MIGAFMVLMQVVPLWAILSRSLQDATGAFVGLANYATYFATPALFQVALNSLTIATVSAGIVVTLAFLYAYALTRTCMPFKGFFRVVSLVPILAPSLLPAIALIYIFGNQGFLRDWLFGASIYGPIGIVIGISFWVFPHALMILTVALASSDARLYEAARVLRAGSVRTFLTVTLPSARYGLVSAFFVSFTLVIADFGVPKVIGGQFNVLAVEIYKQVVGRHDFSMGAVVGTVLLLPAVVAFVIDRFVQRRQVALLSARAVPYVPKPAPVRDALFLLFCTVMAVILLGILGVAAYASFIQFWPYNLSFTLDNYRFDLMDGGGWRSYWNSIQMASWTAVIGTAIVFLGAYAVEKTRRFRAARSSVHFLAMLPMAVPGMVLGLGYVFFFNLPGNPLGFLYHTMAILVLSTIVHYYTVSHLTAVTALKQLDPEFESVSASLKVPAYRTFFRVTLPVCTPAALDVSVYFFVNAMTTVAAVVFLYGPNTTLASVAVLNMDDAGDIAPAAAMAMMIVYTSITVKLLHWLVTRGGLARTQAWRRR
ncbi:MAG: putative 2-aminoethylphosphonate ABC transporter permease subunit [Rhodospirillales bacterium]|nr:MAG: putative 2-aminoethylphosphonate ABC transporter permease subunit [Rhodospirillales bacterium]